MANLITIDQLLESVDLDFEPRWITRDENGWIGLWDKKPIKYKSHWFNSGWRTKIGCLKLSEFDGKGWTECIYEVPRKTTGNEIEQKMLAELERKLNAIVDAAIKAVNELKGAKNE